MRLLLTLAYNGSAWHGWQIQERANPPPTIQGAVEKALFDLYGQKIRLYGAGRTDAGVHAHAQAAHCDVPCLLRDTRHALNARLPHDIRVLSAIATRPDFHARKDAVSKTYIYDYWRESGFVPPQLAPFAWNCGPLDLAMMRTALPYLQLETDFASFQNAGTEMKNTVRRINFIRLEEMPQIEFYPPHAPLLRLFVNADGFLKQMVRNIAGFLAWCGRGKISGEELPRILAKKCRKALPSPTAPACGLALAAIEYGKTIYQGDKS